MAPLATPDIVVPGRRDDGQQRELQAWLLVRMFSGWVRANHVRLVSELHLHR